MLKWQMIIPGMPSKNPFLPMYSDKKAAGGLNITSQNPTGPLLLFSIACRVEY